MFSYKAVTFLYIIIHLGMLVSKNHGVNTPRSAIFIENYCFLQSLEMKYKLGLLHKGDPNESELPDSEKLTEYERKVSKKLLCDKFKSWDDYRKRVWRITNRQPLHELENFEKRGFNDHHLDHKISTWYGWKNDIPAKDIGNIRNLRFIPALENMRKGRKNV